MSLILLKRVSVQMKDHGIAEYLLIPDLPDELLYGPHSVAIQLANLWRLRRERPFMAASVDEQVWPDSLGVDDIAYLRSLPSLTVGGRPGSRIARYVGQGDISPLSLRNEEDFLLLLPQPPPSELPLWPQLSRCAE
jgi:hypothetical protein